MRTCLSMLTRAISEWWLNRTAGDWHLQSPRNFHVRPAGNAEPIIQLTDGFTRAKNLERQGMPLSRELMYQLLQTSIENESIDAARDAHLLLASSPHVHVCLLDDRLIQLFSLCGSLLEANLVFCLVTRPSCHTWHAILSAHTDLGFNKEALHMFGQMQWMGVKPSKVTLLCILKTCGLLSALMKTFLAHNLIVDSKFDLDVEVGNSLLDTYAKCGSVMDACGIFEKLETKDVISWNSLLAGAVLSKQYFLALEYFCKMQETGIEANNITFSCILNVCGALEALPQGRLIHGHLLKGGVSLDIVIRNTLIDMYVRCHTLEDAYKVFESIPDCDMVSWCTIIAGCTQHGYNSLALDLFAKMQQGGLKPDRISYVHAVKACSSLGSSKQGMFMHSEIVCCSFESDVVVGSTLVDMYAKYACLDEALKVFNALQRRNLVSWNTLIGSYVQQEQPTLALLLFERMQQDCVQHNEVTSRWILKACGSIGAMDEGYWIHDRALKAKFESNVLVESSLIDMYMKLNDLKGAKWVLKRSSNPNLTIWNESITDGASHKEMVDASKILENMRNESCISDEVRISCISKACATVKAIGKGMLLHNEIILSCINIDAVLANSLITMYADFGDLMSAQKVFDDLPFKNVVAWNALITGYTQHGSDFSAIELFGKLQQNDVVPDGVTYLSVLKACSNVGAIIQGKVVHDLVMRSLTDDVMIGTALVDMYAKCGALQCARKVLHGMPKRSVVSWGALFSGYGVYGSLDSSKQCLEAMLREGLGPDERIFHSILAACSHSGSVEEGRQHFKAMQEVHGLIPGIEHCNCMVDLLCRAGYLPEAKEFLCALPVVPDVYGWMSLFTACRLHGNKQLARLCFDRVVDLDPNMAGGYLAMLNVFADSEMWTEFHRVHDLWRSTGAAKRPGKAWVEVDNKVHEFNVFRSSDLQPGNVLLVKLKSLKRQMIHHGFSPGLHLSLEPFQDGYGYMF
ncbi:hypothetical protein GOP47_0020204 [Adiantum capillus-veneris]|uniref:Pentatricopeptide repeat-containing protein n=1 Tax=Adiantum capillus-veneris TaxID=13818 RepID=A0A9D4UCI9_ADICA|nr:hypothetical protein GOP47_0020204 [Adiantum capillus-veneris]